MSEPPDHTEAGPSGSAGSRRFVLSRRYAAGTGGVRGLLITVLGDYVRPTRAVIPTSAFIDVMNRLGVDEMACRQALVRAAADGWLVAHRTGRVTRWELSEGFGHFLDLGAQRIFGFTAGQPEWDGRWLVVLARAAETNRSGRHLLRTRLGWMGFGSPAPGTWISTHTDRIGDALAVLDEAGVRNDSQLFLSEYAGGSDPQSLVEQAWDLATVRNGYEEFVAAYTRAPSPDPLVRVTTLVHAWRGLALQDPALPAQLLPKNWIGTAAVKLFHRQHDRWLAAAHREWDRISQLRDGEA
jgi:phenylacetic acid degradation operon negative regulatory protein